MKKLVCLIILVMSFMCTSCVSSIEYIETEEEVLVYDEIFDKIIRFHVIANSDSKEDQDLKIKVRDEVIEYMVPKLEGATSLDDAREILNENIDNVNKLAEEVIQRNSYSYSAKTMISDENFPDKAYGDVIFPQGEYEAFRIVIGEGNGQNWWCVMFPPLCFVDETKDNINSEIIMDKIEENNTVVFKLKFWDKLKELF